MHLSQMRGRRIHDDRLDAQRKNMSEEGKGKGRGKGVVILRWVTIAMDRIDGEIRNGVEGFEIPAEFAIVARYGAGLTVGIEGGGSRRRTK